MCLGSTVFEDVPRVRVRVRVRFRIKVRVRFRLRARVRVRVRVKARVRVRARVRNRVVGCRVRPGVAVDGNRPSPGPVHVIPIVLNEREGVGS